MSTPTGTGAPSARKREKRVTLAEVARLAGVSQTAASFVLTGRHEEMRISAEVAERVMQAARETGYRPNIVSRSLRTGKTQTIGFISDTVATTPFAGNLIKGALEAARDRGHLLLIAETERDEKLQQELLEAMIDRDVDGIVLASMYTRKLAVPQVLHGRHAVLLNAVPLGDARLPSVIPDELEAGRTAARTLLAAGHRKGIYVIGVGSRPNQVTRESLAAAERFRGIRQALSAAGVRLAGAFACADWQPELGYEAARRMLAERSDVRALICFNDRVSVGAYNALAEAGLAVPDDVSVVSFDDDPLASWVRPQLTTIAIPHYELGRRSIELLLDAADAPQASSEPERLPMPLRTRDSVRLLG
jgi:LacI family transcriptional regulator